MAKLVPIKNRVACIRVKSKNETTSGIIIEGIRTGEVDKAKVIAIGPDVDMVEVGNTLLIDWSKVQAVTIEDAPVYFVSQDNIHAVLED